MAVAFNHFPLLARQIAPACKRVVRQTAKDVQDMAVILAPVETHWLQSSIYVATTSGVKYSGVAFTGTTYQLLQRDMFPPELPDNDLTAIVGVGATYGEDVEMGTRYMNAQPFFTPAVDWANQHFMAALDFEGLLQAGITGSLDVEAI